MQPMNAGKGNVRFLIITYVIHHTKEGRPGGYAPYVAEMNLWLKHVDAARVIAPKLDRKFEALDLAYEHPNLEFTKVPPLNFTSIPKSLISLFVLPYVCLQILRGFIWANHIHIRCPGNMGLLGCFLQFFFPEKRKTAKYANNWDWRVKQPWTYRLQQKILRSQALSRNMSVLVYGNWPGESSNVVPFFTASYSEAQKLPCEPRVIDSGRPVRLLFVGTLTQNKRPLESIKICQHLLTRGVNARLDVIGGGSEKEALELYCRGNGLTEKIRFHGKMAPSEVIGYYRMSHFLILLSRSEGWPKVLAEAMWWACLPVATDVSCVRDILGGGERGCLVTPEPADGAERILDLVNNPITYAEKCQDGMLWARQFTVEKFENEISRLI
jgi:glycosyltransferase involved in cell wall biosynthesis